MHAICVSHHRAVAGGIRVRLKHLDALCHDSFSADSRLVILDLWPGSVAQNALMNERKVTDVEEVLDDARTACSHAVWTRDQHLIRRIIEQLEPWNLARAAAEVDPDDAIGFRRAKGRHARLFRRSLLRVGGHEHAPPVGSVGPSVIWAFESNAIDDR